MNKQRNSRFLFAMTIAVLLGTSACQNPFSAAASQKCKLAVSAGASKGRSIVPGDMSVSSYTLTMIAATGETQPYESSTGAFSVENLAAGDYSIEVKGLAATGTVILQGSADVTLVTGQTTSVSVPMTPYQSPSGGTGTLSITVSWPAGMTFDSLSGTLTAADGQSSIDLGDTYPKSKSTSCAIVEYVPAGSYLLTIEAVKAGKAVARNLTDTVLIYNGKTSTGAMTLSDADFSYYTVAYNSNGGSGDVPTDSKHYLAGDNVTVLGNTGGLIKDGYTWGGWTMDNESNGVVFVAGKKFSFSTIPASVTLSARWILPATSVAACGDHVLMTTSDGSLYSWGNDSRYQLGDGTQTSRSSPQKVDSLSGVASVAGYSYGYEDGYSAEYALSFFLKSDGTLWACGYNALGQLGIGTATDQTSPAQVMTGVAAISSGTDGHTMILTTGGALYACGYNGQGQLGTGDTTNRSSPVQVMKDKTVAAVSAGSDFTLILTTEGALYVCGSNYYGQFGNGATSSTSASTPVQVMTGVASVCAGWNASLILKTDGTLWACGYNYNGQLGTGGTTNPSSPVQVMAGTTFAAVSMSSNHAMFLTTDGVLYACGDNYHGQLGDGSTTDRLTPVQVMTGVKAASAGKSTSMIIKTDGSLWGCGDNYFGQIGNGVAASPDTTNKTPTPVQIIY